MVWRKGQAYSQDLRDRVLVAVDEGERVYEVAAQFRVSVSYIYKALERREQTGAATPGTRGGAQRPRCFVATKPPCSCICARTPMPRLANCAGGCSRPAA